MDSTFDRGRVLNELFLKRQKLHLRLLRLSDTLARCRLSAALRLLRVALSRVWADSRKAIPQQDHARKYARFVSDIRTAAHRGGLCAVFFRKILHEEKKNYRIKIIAKNAPIRTLFEWEHAFLFAENNHTIKNRVSFLMKYTMYKQVRRFR